jgi:hypothetical protein
MDSYVQTFPWLLRDSNISHLTRSSLWVTAMFIYITIYSCWRTQAQRWLDSGVNWLPSQGPCEVTLLNRAAVRYCSSDFAIRSANTPLSPTDSYTSTWFFASSLFIILMMESVRTYETIGRPIFQTDYTAVYPRGLSSLYSPLWEPEISHLEIWLYHTACSLRQIVLSVTIVFL